MSHAPFVLKLAFYAPIRQNQQRNANHIRYIATRPGADRGELEPEKIDPGTAAGHVKYAGERPGSHGLFTQDEDHPDLKAVQRELLQHRGVVWRAVLSLREDDAVRLGYTTRKAWETMLRATVAEAAANMGIREDNLRWVAAFHAVQGHPHAHLVWWEKNPTRIRGVISEGEKKDMRRVFVREIYAEERSRLLAEKTALRDLLRETARQDVLTLAREIRQAKLEVRALAGKEPGIAPELNPAAEQELASKLSSLASIMPGHGRIALAYMPQEVKTQTREIADWMLRQPGFIQSAEKYKAIARQLASHHTLRAEALEEAARKAYEDLRDRIAQEVLKGAAAVQKHLERLESASRAVEEAPLEETLPEEKLLVLVTGQAGEKRFIPKHIVYASSEESTQRLWRSVCRTVNRAYRQEKPEAPVVKPELQDELQKEIIERLKELAGAMPDQQGKPGLAYLPGDLQEKARDLAMLLLNREELQGRFGELNNINPERAGRLLEYIADQAVARAYDLIPREVPDIEMVLHPRRQMEAAAKLLAARADLVKGDYGEIYWTVATIYRAMTRLEAPPEIARQAAVRFGRQAGLGEDKIEELIASEISRMEELARKCEEQGLSAPRHISRDAWQRLTENLGLEEHELLYPWFGIKKPEPEVEEEKQRLKELLNPRLVEERVAPALAALKEAGDRPEDPQELRWTLVTLTSTLRALGVEEDEREIIVRSWCHRAGVEITEARLMDVLDRATLDQGEFWMGQRSWSRLMRNLGIEEAPPLPWEITVPRTMVRSSGIVHEVWKAAWRALERERTRAEAQALLLAQKEMERRKKREREEAAERT